MSLISPCFNITLFEWAPNNLQIYQKFAAYKINVNNTDFWQQIGQKSHFHKEISCICSFS